MKNPLLKKLSLKEDHKLLLLNCPQPLLGYFKEADPQTSAGTASFDSVIAFTHHAKELEEFLPRIQKSAKDSGKRWVAYPKKSGSIASDLSRDVIWEHLNRVGLSPNRLISLNEDWSVMSLADSKKQARKSTFGQDPPGVDRKTKTVIPPDDLQQELDSNPEALTFFESLAFSHKREYVGWIHEAKKQETRERRIAQTIELLLQSRKAR